MPVPPPMPVAVSGSRGEFFDLAKRGAALEFVTLGFYRFWLLTDIRRHLWSNTLVDGDAAEYTGRGKELLIGFLVALAILVPIYLGYFLIGLEAEHYQAFASIPLFVFFYLFRQFAIYRARRYRMTRTVWRGVRFWMTGSGWIYALQASLWGLLMILHARADPAMAHRGARTLQDAPFALRRSSGQFRRARLGVLQARLVAVAAHAGRDQLLPDRSVRLRRLQGDRMALVAVRHPVRRCEPGIVIAEERVDRAVLESDRLDGPAGAGLHGLSGAVHRAGGQHERGGIKRIFQHVGIDAEHSVGERVGLALRQAG